MQCSNDLAVKLASYALQGMHIHTCNQLHVHVLVEFLYKDIPEMRTPPLIRTHYMVTATYMIIKKCKNILPEIRIPSDIDSP